MMEDRSSPPRRRRTTAPPSACGISRPSPRATSCPRGTAEAARGRGRLLHPPRVLERASDDASGVVSGSALFGTGLWTRDTGHGTRDAGCAVHQRGRARHAEPGLGAAGRGADRRGSQRADVLRGKRGVSPATPQFDAGDAETRETPIRIGGVAKETSRVIHRRRVSLHERVILRVWFVPAPSPGASAGATRESPRAFSGDARATLTRGRSSMTNDDDSRTRMAFQCDISMGALVPLPGGTRGQKLVSLSMSGGRARAGAVLSAPPEHAATPDARGRVWKGPFARESRFDPPGPGLDPR